MGIRRKIGSILAPIIGLVFFIVALIILQRELKEIHYQQIHLYFNQLPFTRLGLSILFTFVSFLALSFNEALLFIYIRHPLPFGKTGLASFVSTAISHSIGYAFLTGGSLRFRFYTNWKISALEISNVIGVHALIFWLGFLTLSGLLFLFHPLLIPPSLNLPFATILPLALLFLLLVVLYFAMVLLKVNFRIRGWEFRAPSLPLSLAMISISAGDWIFSGMALFILLPSSHHLSIPLFLGIYLLAQIAGASSQVPGGLGVFESVFFILLGSGAHPPAVAAALLAYRLIYYLMPLIFSAAILGLHEAIPKLDHIKRISKLFGNWLSSLVPHVFAFTSLVGGAVLLFSGATPAVGTRLGWVSRIFPLPVVELSHFLGSLTGVGLLFLAHGLQRRFARAYRLTVILLIAGILFSLLKGFDYEEAMILAIMLLALSPNGRFFYRQAPLKTRAFSLPWLAAIIAVLASSFWLGMFSYKHLDYSHDLWWQFEFSADAPRSLRATIGAMGLVLLLAIRQLLKPAPPGPSKPEAGELEKIMPVIRESPETVAHLALLGDKSLLSSSSGHTFIMYANEGRSWVSMGDPIGEEREKGELIWKFHELSDLHNGWTVFYEVGKQNLHYYIDLGLTLIKLGEEALVSLETVSLTGKSNKWFRYITHHLEEQGYRFEIIPAVQVPPLLPELRRISDDWLEKKRTREKGFSLGYFNESYLALFDLATVRKEGKIVAFANIWKGGGFHELSVDLMRHSDEAPEGTMDYLFIQLMLRGQEQGYRWFNLGMAPFSGMEGRLQAPIWQKLGSTLFRYGEQFYNFQGVRQYKEKFDPVWEPRYLASPGGFALPRILANLSALVSRGIKGVVGK